MIPGSSTASHNPVPLSSGAHKAICQLGSVEALAAGQTLVTKSEPNSHLYLVEEGEVDLLTDSGATIVGPSGLVGEYGFLAGTQNATVVARTPVRVRRISRDEVAQVFVQEPMELYAFLDELQRLQRFRGTHAPSFAQSFAASLAEESLSHRAVRHPYLQLLGAGELPDLRWALKDFATQYYGYSRYFPRYLTTVMSRLDVAEHRNALLDNLTEESGSYEPDELGALAKLGIEPDWFVGEPHPKLFARFARAMGAEVDNTEEADQVVCWREMFLEILRNGSPAEAVGALGLGTENIVSTIYLPFVQAIKRLDLNPRDSVFFVLHTAIDDDHQEVLQRIATWYAGSQQGRSDLRRGMLKALQCRAGFWDWLLERAQNPWQARSVL